MRSITKELLEELKNASDIDAFFKRYESDLINKTSTEYLNELLEIKGLKVSVVAEGSGAGEYAYKIFKGERNPSRNVLISVAFGMSLALEETQLLLRVSKFAVLDSRDKRDSVIIYCISRGMSVFEADDMLDSQGLTTLN